MQSIIVAISTLLNLIITSLEGLPLLLLNEPVFVLLFHESCLMNDPKNVFSLGLCQKEHAVPVSFEFGL